jgi:arylsulfatase A-like enzyme
MGKASAEVAANGDHAELLLVRAGQTLLHVLRDRRRARPTSCAQGVDVAEWASLSEDQRRLYTRIMEVFAGFVSHADHHFGRILDTLERIGELDNTIIMIISDNGASAEGGATGSFNEMLFFNMVPESFEDNLAKIDELGGTKAYNHYPWGWTWARHSSSPAPSTR